MINVKWGIFSGLAAFILALVTSLLMTQNALSAALLNAIIFAILFFGMGVCTHILISKFLPELLSGDTSEEPINILFSADSPGTRVNLSVGDISGAALPGTNYEAHGIDSIENIADLVAGKLKPAKKTIDVDQTFTNSYTEDAGDFSPIQDSSIADDSDSGDFSLSFDNFVPGTGIAELDSFMDSYSFDSNDSNEETVERKVSRNKSTALEGDFNPKEIASGIRTVLEKDKN